ncbi:transglycosylase domain-containing protein [Conexibacter sp. SYSU D00693]|uniref:transglycosylase domain-containing protein n=1 Tax=Conexibacter sp. SYSU D00693 TaxID=2812560 RepID=UPI00196B509D|nr:transglycosylase domain-containing protein [Conexibacter sp. SYSU D00693]
MSRRERQRRRRRNQGGPGRILFLSLGVVTALVAIAGLSFVGWIVSVATSGPDLTELKARDKGATSVVFDADGRRLGVIQAPVLRTPIPSSAIPEVMKQATVSIEDRRFFEHKGVDFEGIVRAAFKNLESGGDTVQGGSTLTMQLVRNLYTGDDTRSGIDGFKRKIREARLAEDLEDLHPGAQGKKWILTTYINSVPYGTVGGQEALGVSAAARVFFNKPAGKLELHEAALLAGLPQAPSLYNPFQNPDRARARRNDVLSRMADEGYISHAAANEAASRPLGVQQSGFYTRREERFFFDYVRQQLIDEYGIERVRQGGLRVYTTLDRSKQRAARASIAKAVAGRDRSAAIVTVDPANGHIVAMASSANYGDLEYNLAAQGKYQAGSTFKTMTLMAALRRGVDPNSTSYTSMPLKFNDPEYGPIDVKTYSGSYIGRANLVKATLTSDNSIYQQLALDVGPDQVAQTARDMGIKSKLLGYPAESLGGLRHGVSPLEMANAYATIASGGFRNRATAITKVCFPLGSGKFDCRTRKARRHKAFSDGVTYEATKILEKNVTGGTGTKAQIGCPAAGKTGTTDDFTDAWFVGYTPRLATAVWVGHAKDKRTLGPGSAGGEVAAPIWGDYMKTAHGKFCGQFPKPTEPFKARPFFGKYARTGVKGNKADRDYRIDPGGATDLERGRDDRAPGDLYEDLDGNGGGNGGTGGQGTSTPSTPTPTPTPSTPTPGTQAPAPTAPPAPDGGTAAGGAPPP